MAIKQTAPLIARFAALSLLWTMGGGAYASTLAPAGVAAQVLFNFPPGINIGTFGTFPLSGPGGFLQFSSVGEPGPFAAAEAHVAPGFFGRSSGQIIYSMEILGPPGEVPVSVAVAGGASGSSSTQPFTSFALKALWRIDDVNLGLAQVFAEGIETPALQGSFSESFGHSVDLMLTAGHIYRVTLTADAAAGAVDSDSQTFAAAFIDPVFSFGPGIGPEYTFHFSEGIGNSPVPLPGTLLLIAPALAGLLRFVRATR
ncbi:MAG: hypothetical protein AB7Q97_16270 [Gammaproteobacteria bacterium]